MSGLKYFLGLILLIGAAWGGMVWQKQHTPQIAVVNLIKVIESSNRVFALREINDAKLDELSTWLDKAKLTIQNEKDKYKKQDLVMQYQDLARQKEAIIRHEYEEKMQKITTDIDKIINDVADEQNCAFVLFKTGVFRGGVNLTPLVIERVNAVE